jgi:hypothetical protein
VVLAEARAVPRTVVGVEGEEEVVVHVEVEVVAAERGGGEGENGGEEGGEAELYQQSQQRACSAFSRLGSAASLPCPCSVVGLQRARCHLH